MKRRMNDLLKIDPIMQEVPYDLILNEQRKILAEIYTLPKRYLNDGKLIKQGGLIK